MDDLLLASPSQTSSLEERNCLLKLLALKVYKVLKKNFSLPNFSIYGIRYRNNGYI